MSMPDPASSNRPAGMETGESAPRHPGAGAAWLARLSRLGRGCSSRWPWLVGATAAFAAAGFLAGYASGSYTARVELLATSLPATVTATGANAPLGDGAAVDALVELLRSETALRRVAQVARPSVTPDRIAAASEVRRLPDSGLIRIQVRGSDPQGVADLANLYGQEASAAAREIWLHQCRELDRDITQRLTAVDEEIARTSREWVDFQRQTLGTDFRGDEGSSLRQLTELDRKVEALRSQTAEGDSAIQNLHREIARLSPALAAARDALAQALTRFTEEHPKVKELRATLASLEAQLVSQTNAAQSGMLVLSSPAAVSLYTRLLELKSQQTALSRELDAAQQRRQELRAQMTDLPGHQATYVRLKSQLEALRDQRFLLARRQQEVRLAEPHAGGARLIASASLESMDRSPKIRAGLALGSLAGAGGLLLAALWAAAFPSTARRIRSARELEDATGLPALASLGDLGPMTLQDREEWAFRTLTLLRGRCAPLDREALICGFTSATHAEGRSTWIGLLAEAADRLGYRVATISAARPQQALEVVANTAEPAAATEAATRGPVWPDLGSLALTRTSPSGASMPVGAWVRDLDHREQWRQAVQQWRSADGLVVLVEMPPASLPEAVLLAQGLPNVVWLCGKDMVSFSETRLHLDTLRHARTHLVGCVFNQGPAAGRKQGRLLAAGVLAGLLWLASGTQAQETNQAPAPPPPAVAEAVRPVSLAAPDRMADWQKRLLLGPGDQFDVSLYDQPDSLRAGLVIGPDGRINYLEARDVMAAGLTVDELRARLEAVLAKFRRTPRVVLNPVAYNSKKYYVLGNVNQKGVFLLDRPVSIIEAIARARGFVTGPPGGSAAVAASPTLLLRNPLVQADYAHSFLVRRGGDGVFRRQAVDFEALFLRGDLTQNIALEPDDYLFFPPAEAQEAYVLGAVHLPGVVPFTPDMTALGAIVGRGGFTDKAWRQKVLVVRGSLNRPQTFVINASDILAARAPDFPLKNRDIVYVHTKPWAKAQELLEYAAMNFVSAYVLGVTTKGIYGDELAIPE